jgi:lipopolysaccharide heptosyltransferase I
VNQTDFKNILLIRLSALGDVIHCLPALDALRRHFPQARISWAVEETAAGLLEGHPQLNEVIILPRRAWAASLKNPLKWPALSVGVAKFFSRLRKRRFDLAIDFQGNLRSGLVNGLSGAKVRLARGPSHAKEGSHIFATHHHAPPVRIHRVERALSMVQSLGVDISNAKGIVPVDPQARETVSRWLQEIGGNKSARLVAIHPGTSKFGTLKKWDTEKYRALAERLVREDGAFVVLTWGTEDERLECEAIAKGAGIHVAPRFTLKELVALLEKAALFIGADTGPLHIAAALGTRVVGIYGPKDPVIYGPYGEGHTVVRSGEPCSPCTLRRCEEMRCMKKIAAEDVHLAAKEILSSSH